MLVGKKYKINVERASKNLDLVFVTTCAVYGIHNTHTQ